MTEGRTGRARRGRARRVVLVSTALMVLVASVVAAAVMLRGCGVEPLPQPTGSATAGLRSRYVGAFGDTGSQRLVEPVGVATAKDRVYVADAGAHSVAVFDTDGKRVSTVTGGGMKVPAYVAVDPRDGRVLVSDRETGMLLIFAADGKPKGVFDSKLPAGVAATGTAGPWRPLAVAFAADGTLYVADVAHEHRILMFAPDGLFLRAFTGPDGEGLSYPNGIAVLGSDVVVADSNNARLLIFSPDGSIRRQIRVGGLPRGVALVSSRTDQGASGSLVVADTIAGKLTLWATDGTPLGEAGRAGFGGGEFAYPTGVAAGTGGSVYVTDTGNRRIQIWTIDPESTASLAPLGASAPAPWWLWAVLAAGATLLGAGIIIVLLAARRRVSAVGPRSDATVERAERPEPRVSGAARGPDKV